VFNTIVTPALDGDPRPNPLEAPFEQRGGDVVIVCE
jgi:hypothetical protein